MNKISDFQQVPTRDVIAALQANPDTTKEQLHAALINAFERIAALEDDWAELG